MVSDEQKKSATRLRIKVRLLWCWYDLWIGAYVDRTNKAVYICPLPTVVIKILWWKETIDDVSFARGWKDATDYIREMIRLNGDHERAIESALEIIRHD